MSSNDSQIKWQRQGPANAFEVARLWQGTPGLAKMNERGLRGWTKGGFKDIFMVKQLQRGSSLKKMRLYKKRTSSSF